MSDRRARVLGKMLSQYIGKNVVVAGKLTKVSSNGDCVELTTFDNIKINVNLPSPLEGNAEGDFEIWGVVKSKGTIEASQCVRFEADDTQEFDAKAYNDLVIILHAINDRRWQLDDSSRALSA